MKTDWLTSGYPHIWLPYTQMKITPPPLPVVNAQDSTLHLADGRTLIDGIANWWSACHGHKHPHLLQAVEKQLHILPHVMFGGLAHEPAYTLAQKLAAITPGDLSRVFFTDSGSVAVEVALKMALQYWRNQGKPNKTKFICFRNGYHGDTFGAMSVSDPDQNYHQAYKTNLQMHFVVDLPTGEYSFAEFEGLLADMERSIAGCIIEPLVQGAGGMKFHSADTLAEIHRLCEKHNILFIADEIATGFGRTGYFFGCQEAGVTPDIMCLGKALTGGLLTLAAAIARPYVFDAFYDEDPDHALMHGPTYMGNPLACTAALASLELFAAEPRLQQVEEIERQLRDELNPCVMLKGVKDVRVRGAIGVVQLHPQYLDKAALRKKFIELGVWLRPIEDVVYITPAFTIQPEELRKLTHAVFQALEETQPQT
jgi:adenosylmethionine---8-amino-7-oxononanoate aminotransferase